MTVLARPIVFLAAAVLTAVQPSWVGAQAPVDGSRITGRVTDESGAALPGVTVTLRASGGGPTTTLVTDGVGQFVSMSLPPGAYGVTFELAGFASRTRPDVHVRGGDVLVLDEQLALASLVETVEVRAAAPPPPPPPPPAEPPVRLLPPTRPEPVPVAPEVLASVCGPGQRGDGSFTIGHLIAHRDEPGRRLYGRGDVLVLDIGADLGLQAGQNLVVRRRMLAADRGRTVARGGGGEQTAGLIQVVEPGATTAVAIVVYTCGELFAGDAVEPFDALPMWTAQGLRTPQFDDPGHVILGEHGQVMGAPRQLMVIDRGTAQGAERGQRLTIFRRSLGGQGPVLSVADAIIVAVRTDSATIRIERASDAVSVGDLVALHR